MPEIRYEASYYDLSGLFALTAALAVTVLTATLVVRLWKR